MTSLLERAIAYRSENADMHMQLIDRIIDGSRSDLNIIEYARSYESAENAQQFVEDATKVFLQYTITENRKEYLLEILLDGAEVYDWSTYNENAEARLVEFFKALLRLSEYQLS